MSRPISDFAFGWKPGWHARAFARAKEDDSRFSDEDILTILRAGDAGLKVEALCEAGDIPIETYYVWKAKYGGLNPTEIRARREKKRRHGRALAVSATAATVALVAVGVGYAFVAPMRGEPTPAQTIAPPAADRTPPQAKAARDAAPEQSATSPAPARAPGSVSGAPSAKGEASAEAQPSAPTANPPAPGKPVVRVEAAEIDTADPNGVSVQVASAARLDEARVVMERLASLGFPVHMTTKVLNGIEMYRVRVGPLTSRAVAEDVARQLEHAGFASPWITK